LAPAGLRRHAEAGAETESGTVSDQEPCMSIRLLGACVLSACLAATASAQTTPDTPRPDTLPPTLPQVPVSSPADLPDLPPLPPLPLPLPTPSPHPAIVVEAQERPSPAPGPMARAGWVQPPPDAPPPVRFDGPTGPVPGRFWMTNEALFWWIQGTRLPALVSTTPPGVSPTLAGLTSLGAQSIYGPGPQDNNLRLGYRLTLGGYLDSDRRFALEANVFMTANGGNQFNAMSDGTPTLARPAWNSVSNAWVAEPIAVPGIADGSIHIATRTTGIVGAGIWLRENFTRSDDPCDTCRLCGPGGCGANGCGGDSDGKWYCRFDALFGYRYQRLSDNLEIDDIVNAIAPLNGVPAGGTLQRTDQFHTSNTFHGIDLGMTGELQRGPWTASATAKVAVGFNDSSVDIFGLRNLNGVISEGGLLAQPTNMGHVSHVLSSAIPEIDLKIGYSFSPTVRVFVGYTFLYWYHVVRAANEVNPFVDPAFLTTGAPTGNLPTQPARMLDDRSIWMQGLSLGFEWRF
jgi:hypothetical protein